MSSVKLGETPDMSAGRDAVHVAVMPCRAGEPLEPGARVYIDMETQVALNAVTSPPVGIVDPYLAAPVERHGVFWLCLFPESTTSLRHEWTAPVIDRALSERWLRDFVARKYDVDYDDMMRVALAIADGDESYERCHLEESIELGDEAEAFWKHFERAMSRSVSGDRRVEYIPCRC
jgi:hypothetical protein